MTVTLVKINKGLNGEIVQKSSQVKVQISSSEGLVLYRNRFSFCERLV